MRSSKVNWVHSIPFFLMHLAALLAFWTPFDWNLVLLCGASYFIRMFAITAGYHRYFSHRAYKTNRFFQFVLAWMGTMAVQKGVLWWAANHRHHHRFSDRPEDLHSPVQNGFWWSHVGWILSNQYDETRWDLIPDLAKFPELRFLNRFHLLPPILFAVSLLIFTGFPGLVWGFFVSTVLLWHGTFTINSLSHVFGTQRYSTSDASRNNGLLALITLGEGWHNNHHCFMSSANQGFFWWELDVSYGILKIMSRLGIVRNLKKAPVHLLESRRIRPPLSEKVAPLINEQAPQDRNSCSVS